MKKNYTFHKRKVWIVFFLCLLMILCPIGRLIYLMGFRSDYYYEKAEDLHERERDIKAARGEIVDAKGKVLAANKTVCTISVIHSQIKEPEKVIALLTEKLWISEQTVRKKVEKISSIERIRTNVEKETGDEIRNAGFAGIKVDEDYRRYYPMGTLASKVLGFTGGDNQGIIGLEVEYDDILKGKPGKILTTTDARGIELDGIGENREEPQKGYTLRISLDADIQKYVQQAAQIWGVSQNDFLDCINFLALAKYIQLRTIMDKVLVPDFADIEWTLLEVRLTDTGIRVLQGNIKDDMIEV